MDALLHQPYMILDHFLPTHLLEDLQAYFSKIKEEERLRQAGIGKHSEQVTAIRSDMIYWLPDEVKELNPTLCHIQNFMDELCRFYRIPTLVPELHLAEYPQGAYYKKHVDTFKNDNSRMITFILYLNAGYKEGDGGQLRIFLEDETFIDIAPLNNRLVVFKSDELPHEVLPTHTTRKSLTGWFKKDPLF